MIGADAVAWLSLWERSVPKAPRRRRRELLVSAGPSGDTSARQLAVGRANAQLLRLHRAMFGARLACQTSCPRCDAALELDLDIEDLLGREPPQQAGPMQIQLGEWEVVFRLPTEEDVDASLREPDPAAARDVLLCRCVTTCRRGTEESSVSSAPPEVIATVGGRMEEGDPLALLEFDLRCASCDHAWSSTLDVDEILWARLNAWARRLVRDVHALAQAYGWSERTIAKMSPWKRQLYLDMVAG